MTAAVRAPRPSPAGPAAPSPAAAGPAPRPGVPARAILALIRLYQLARSGRPSPCRYLPSCSAYATEALSRHGAWRGGWLSLRRVSRCHPWGGHGVDPVPD